MRGQDFRTLKLFCLWPTLPPSVKVLGMILCSLLSLFFLSVCLSLPSSLSLSHWSHSDAAQLTGCWNLVANSLCLSVSLSQLLGRWDTFEHLSSWGDRTIKSIYYSACLPACLPVHPFCVHPMWLLGHWNTFSLSLSACLPFVRPAVLSLFVCLLSLSLPLSLPLSCAFSKKLMWNKVCDAEKKGRSAGTYTEWIFYGTKHCFSNVNKKNTGK